MWAWAQKPPHLHLPGLVHAQAAHPHLCPRISLATPSPPPSWVLPKPTDHVDHARLSGPKRTHSLHQAALDPCPPGTPTNRTPKRGSPALAQEVNSQMCTQRHGNLERNPLNCLFDSKATHRCSTIQKSKPRQTGCQRQCMDV